MMMAGRASHPGLAGANNTFVATPTFAAGMEATKRILMSVPLDSVEAAAMEAAAMEAAAMEVAPLVVAMMMAGRASHPGPAGANNTFVATPTFAGGMEATKRILMSVALDSVEAAAMEVAAMEAAAMEVAPLVEAMMMAGRASHPGLAGANNTFVATTTFAGGMEATRRIWTSVVLAFAERPLHRQR